MSAETYSEQGNPVLLKEILQVLEEEKPVFEGLLKFADWEKKLEEEQIELARRQTSLTSDLVKNSALRTDLAAEHRTEQTAGQEFRSTDRASRKTHRDVGSAYGIGQTTGQEFRSADRASRETHRDVGQSSGYFQQENRTGRTTHDTG